MKSALFCVGMDLTGIDLHGIEEIGIPHCFFDARAKGMAEQMGIENIPS